MTIINIISSIVINKEAFKIYISQNSKMLSAVVSWIEILEIFFFNFFLL